MGRSISPGCCSTPEPIRISAMTNTARRRSAGRTFSRARSLRRSCGRRAEANKRSPSRSAAPRRGRQNPVAPQPLAPALGRAGAVLGLRQARSGRSGEAAARPPIKVGPREAAMLLQRIALVAGAAFAWTFVSASSIPPAAAQGANSAAVALAGQVASAEEGPMEGVIVSAKKDGSTITVSVITNSQGRYSSPAARLEPGRYSLQIRAVGYDLEGPKNADVAAGTPTSADLKLRKSRNLSKQHTNAKWMMSAPGTDDDKLQLINCVSCHTLERVVKSSHDADEFVQVIARMNGYAQVSQPIKHK